MTAALPAESIQALLRPSSVAIVGATPGSGRGGWIHEQLLRYGFDGPIYPVNPKYDEIRGLPAYPSLAAIPAPVDFVAVALGAGHAVRVMQECAAKRIRAALFVASGFAEVGAAGAAIQAELRRIAFEHGIAVCGPNCYGIANIHGRFAAYGGALTEPLRPGPIALLFQSGALTHAAMDPVALRSSGYSFIITTGNEAVVELADYINALADDRHTRVIACFIEGIASPARFFAAARRAIGNGKRLLVLKTGRSALAQRAALAHTGALTGPDAVYDALFRQIGIVRVADLDELIETAELLCTLPDPASHGAAIVSISGGTCGMAADMAQAAGLKLASLDAATITQLRAILPPFATPNNPLDLTGAIGEDPTLLPRTLATLCGDPAVGMVALALNTPIGGDPVSRALYQEMCRELAASHARHQIPHVAFSVSSGAYDPQIIADMQAAGVPLLMGMREAIQALAHWQRIAQLRPFVPDSHQRPLAPEIRKLLHDTPQPILGERAAKGLLAAAGLPVCREILAGTAAEAVIAAEQIGYPVALKIDSPDIAHKTEAGGVLLNLADRAAVEHAFHSLLKRAYSWMPNARIAGVLVQEMISGGVETLLGVANHPGLGPVVVFGLGGTLVEMLDDWAMRAAPFDVAEAQAMIDETRAATILAGWRGAPPCDREALAHVITTLSQLAWQLRETLDSIDINPLIV
ncbi:MAG TPA: acetate--CoA ligase family protein, partial [Roseiflexaceae bacterium]|nr:acetate--CoA ligase family protein [Roseiflexaceae bacterium]